jgi:hypothetical protein
MTRQRIKIRRQLIGLLEPSIKLRHIRQNIDEVIPILPPLLRRERHCNLSRDEQRGDRQKDGTLHVSSAIDFIA